MWALVTVVQTCALPIFCEMDLVFLCVDRGAAKQAIVPSLESAGITFIDVGMGVTRTDQGLSGLLRVTTSTPASRDMARCRISFADDDGEEDEYKTNVQKIGRAHV